MIRTSSSSPRRSRGGFTIGLVVGLLIGLSAALGVALYVTKAPNPFVNKVPQRPAGSDQAEAERNRTWDPNGSLASRTPMPAQPAPPVSAPPLLVPPTVTDPLVAAPPTAASTPGRRASSPRDAAVERALAQAQAEGRDAPPGLATPSSGSDPFVYFVQAGAFARSEDAEQQRAKLAMAGVESKLFERDQAGRTVWRVRVGPFNRKDDADAAKEKLGQSGVDAALVRVQR